MALRRTAEKISRGTSFRRESGGGLLGRDLCAANEAGRFINYQTRRFDVAVHAASRPQFAALRGGDVAVHGAVDNDRSRLDVALDPRLFAHGEPALGIDSSFDFAIEGELLLEFNRAFNGNSTRESAAMSAQLRRAVRRRFGFDRWGRGRWRRHWHGGFDFSAA